MRVGDSRVFGYRINGMIVHNIGEVINVGRKTLDGLRVVEVRFKDGIRSYSLDHFQQR
ncbi:hypothetical protein [Paenibacillus bouchesdurhonensis]|uniref:hypothetical protein n=1 Tax=Paenibacillus bouchesdurhonensis TaxID=1870990 RepID=UPI001902878A|nr:hypothetical protein [Paenibacillus bouchesdurhonensis]